MRRLEGLDLDWSPVGSETSAAYVRIPPGDYVFRVRACNNDGLWNMEGVHLRLRVTPPFWQTGWFAAAVAVSLVGIGVLLHASRLRRTVNQLRSQALERGDIAQAVREVASELMSGGRPKVEVEVHGAPRRLSVAAEHHVFRIAQEALTNAVRHAQASGVRVSLAFRGDVVELTVCDDGRGLTSEKPDHGFHFGLSGTRERARALGTRLEVESAPGQGTAIRVRWSEKADHAGGAPGA